MSDDACSVLDEWVAQWSLGLSVAWNVTVMFFVVGLALALVVGLVVLVGTSLREVPR